MLWLEHMSKIFDLLQAVETIRSKITEDEYASIVHIIGEVHADYFPNIQTAKTYPITPREVVGLVKGFLNGESRIQTEVACFLLNENESYHYTEYGFETFSEWMESVGFYVSLNRVFEV